jgi:hypothetical protein
MAKTAHVMVARGKWSDLLGKRALEKKEEFILT